MVARVPRGPSVNQAPRRPIEALTLPAYIPVETYPVRVREDGMVVVDV